jgi:hemerythrin
MQPFKWGRAHTVFVPEIDAEHRNLYRIAEEARKAVTAGTNRARSHALLMALVSAADEHFRHEERRMQAAHYGSYKWHKQQHDSVRKRAKTVLRKVAKGETGAALLLLDFISSWLKDHMAVADRMMGAYLRNYERQHTRLAS